MPIHVSCHTCHSEFNAPDAAAGKRTKCPKCGGVIEIPAALIVDEVVEAEEAPAAPFADDEFEVEPPPELPAQDDRKPCPMCGEMIQRDAIKCRFCGEVLDRSMLGALGGAGDARDPAWQKVRKGLSVLYTSTVLMIITVVVLFLTGMIMGVMGAAGGADDLPAGLLIVTLLGGLVMLGCGIAAIVGTIMCTSVPDASGARGFALGAAVCMVVYIVVSMIGGAIDQEALASVGGLLAIVGTVLFILFMRRSATYLGNHDLAASAGRFLIFAVSIIVGVFVLAIVAGVMQAPAIMIILGLTMIVAGLVYIVWYLRLIKSLMTTIDTSM